MVNKIDLYMPACIVDASHFDGHRQKVLREINAWKNENLFRSGDGEQISRTDWNVPASVERPYVASLLPVFDAARLVISKEYKKDINHIRLYNYWFQQYMESDFHDWHSHHEAQFSCVWYVEKPEGTPATTLFTSFGDVEVDAKEGDLLIFPSAYTHKSSENMSCERKTAIAFNF